MINIISIKKFLIFIMVILASSLFGMNNRNIKPEFMDIKICKIKIIKLSSYSKNDVYTLLNDYKITSKVLNNIFNQIDNYVEIEIYFKFKNKSRYNNDKLYTTYTVKEIKLFFDNKIVYYGLKDKTIPFLETLFPGKSSKYYPRGKAIVKIPSNIRINNYNDIIINTNYEILYSKGCLNKKKNLFKLLKYNTNKYWTSIKDSTDNDTMYVLE